MDADELRYETETRQTLKSGDSATETCGVKKTLVSVDADLCVWRETSEGDWNKNIVRFLLLQDDVLCEYDRSNQTFRAGPVSTGKFRTSSDLDERTHAFLCQPVLTPLLPIPVGFQWHVMSAEGHVDFMLESVRKVESTTILYIQRRGVFPLPGYYRNKAHFPQRFTVEREGITTFDLGRSLILEDQIRDTIRTETDDAKLNGMIIETYTKLLHSTTER